MKSATITAPALALAIDVEKSQVFDSVDSRLAETGGADIDSLVAKFAAEITRTPAARR